MRHQRVALPPSQSKHHYMLTLQSTVQASLYADTTITQSKHHYTPTPSQSKHHYMLTLQSTIQASLYADTTITQSKHHYTPTLQSTVQASLHTDTTIHIHSHIQGGPIKTVPFVFRCSIYTREHDSTLSLRSSRNQGRCKLLPRNSAAGSFHSI